MSKKDNIMSKYFLILLFFLFGCSNVQEEREQNLDKGYYENGNVKYEAPLKDGEWHGLVRSYYPNGQLQAKVEWEKGIKEGKAEYYYENGSIEAIGNYKNNSLKVGEFLLFKENGLLREQQIYDSLGNLIYYAEYNEKGEKTIDSLLPIIQAKKDTVSLGEEYSASVSFGLNMNGQLTVEIGELVDNSFKKKAEVKPDENNLIIVRSTPEKRGLNTIALKFKYEKAKEDTFSLDQTITNHSFFVR
jgi:hypothetical protein